MKMKSSLCLIGLGIGGTLLYQQLKNGNDPDGNKDGGKNTLVLPGSGAAGSLTIDCMKKVYLA